MPFFSTQRPGSRGPGTELLQLGLGRAGFPPGGTDGIFGLKTLSAVKAFQRRAGLEPDGVAGPRTWRALTPFLTGYTVRTVRQNDTLYSLAAANGTTVRAIETANPGIDPLRLRIGSNVTIPFSFPVVPLNVSFTSTLLELCVTGLKARYPFIRTGSIGRSVAGSALWYLSIGSGPNQVMWNAAHHANEWITSPLLMKYLENYALAYSRGGVISGRSASALYSASSLWVVPMVNPDGVDLVTGELSSGRFYINAANIASDYPAIPFTHGWKANIAGIDPNLQYPAGWENAQQIKFAQGFTSPAPRDYVGTTPLEAPESRAMYDFTLSKDFSITLSYHAQGGVIYWKYLDIEPPGARDTALLFGEASGYAVSDTPSESGYAGYKDWFILKYNRPGYTIEVGRGVSPLPLEQLPGIYSENEELLTLSLTVTAGG